MSAGSRHSDERRTRRPATIPRPRGGTRPVARGHRELPANTAFIVVASALVTVFLCSGTPVPLYNTYRQEFGVTSADLALTTVLYLATTALALLFLGRLSDAWGRRPVAVLAVLLSAAGALVLTGVQGAGLLIVGRVLQGIACGVASSALGAYVGELAPDRAAWLVPTITGSAPAFAIPVGALVSGALVQYGPASRHLVYGLVALALLVCAVALTRCPDSAGAGTRTLRQALRPRVQLPVGRRLTVVVVAAAVIATWSLSGFFQAFSPALTADQFGSTNALLAAVVFASIVVLSPVGGTLTARLRPLTALALGATVFAVATVVVVVGVHTGQIVVLLVGSFTGGVALGAVGGSGMRLMLAGSTPGQRAGIIATVYLISYSGAAVPGLVGGQVSHLVTLPQLVSGYGALVWVSSAVCLVGIAVLRRPRKENP